MTPLNPEEKIFSLGDLSWLFRRKKKWMLYASAFCAMAAALYVFSKPVVYQTEASFMVGEEKKMNAGASLREFFSNAGGEVPHAVTFMKSSRILQPLAARLGLQAQVDEDRGWLRRLWSRFLDIVYAETGAKTPDRDPFRFSHVSYDGEKTLQLQLIFLDRDCFEIRRGLQKIHGRVNEPVDIGEASLCLAHVPLHMKTGLDYRLKIITLRDATNGIRSRLQIAPNKFNYMLLELSILLRDRYLGAEILNELMKEYQRYLKNDFNETSQMELAYLEERQKDLFAKLGQAYDEHVSYMCGNVGQKGFLSADQQTQAFLKPYQELFSRSLFADLEMDHLTFCREHPTTLCAEETSSCGAAIQRLRQEIQNLEGQRDLLGAALLVRPAGHEDADDLSELPHEQQLQLVRMDLDATKNALDGIEKNDGLPLRLELFHDPDHVVQSWAERIQEHGEEKKDLEEYLRNLVRLFSVREKMLFARQFHPHKENTELNGVDLATANHLLIEASQGMDASKAAMQHYRHFLNRIDDPAFELATLGAVLKDSVSQQILSEAAKLHLTMEDEGSYSAKELQRNVRENAVQRKILSEHLKQMVVVEQLNRSIFQDKIASLQQIALDCINRQIYLDREQIAETARQRKESLMREKEILEKKMRDLRGEMNGLPEKWRAESLLKLRTEMGVKMMEAVAQMVESKTIGHHLHYVASKPFELAAPAAQPQKPDLLLFLLAGATAGALCMYLGAFLQGLYRGFPVRGDTLQALCYPFAGPISFRAGGPDIGRLPDEDLESLRKALLKIDETPQAKTIALLAGKGPDYSHALARLIAQTGRKVLLARCDFTSACLPNDAPGLLQAIDGDLSLDLIRSFGAYDVLPSGGCSRFGAELLRSQAASRTLERLSSAYDHILLLGKAPLDSAESASLLCLSQAAVATVVEEPIDLLTPLMRWAYHEGRFRLTFFVASRSS